MGSYIYEEILLLRWILGLLSRVRVLDCSRYSLPILYNNVFSRGILPCEDRSKLALPHSGALEKKLEKIL